MNRERFAFALERISPEEWALFERFASQFLVSDYPALRTVASASGDLGRDSELFSPQGDPSVLLQYSVTKDWPSKIRTTAKRIRENFPDAAILVYVTNQVIGADGDEIKKELRQKYQLVLDIHDRGWFLDRMMAPQERLGIAEQLARDVVDPYLVSREVIETKALALTELEAKAAVLYLQLQWEDDTREKGLTKLSFEGLVKSVLRNTSSSARLRVHDVRGAVANLLSHHPREFIDTQVNSALDRLDKRAIRYYRRDDEVCLTQAEAQKVAEGIARKELSDEALLREIKQLLGDYSEHPLPPQDAQALTTRARRILDTYLFRKGEEFAAAVAQNLSLGVQDDTFDTLVSNDFANDPDSTGLGDVAISAVRLTLREVLQRSPPAIQAYLREIADGYTLFAFLRSVPDVQKAVQKIFRSGYIWLDTSVILPVMAECLLPVEEQAISRLLRAAVDAGIELRVTSGVVEELERHINRCNTYAGMQMGQWIGRVPFLYAMFALSGRSASGFRAWIENFCGTQRPEDDIADYLRSEWKIKLEDLADFVDKAAPDLKFEVERIWREAHEARRNLGFIEYDDYVIDRLAKHDVECFLGVLGKRKEHDLGELGYGHWWLTFDKTVRDFEEKLRQSIGPTAPKAPVMSPDFLSNYIAFGPSRGAVKKSTESSLPVAMFTMLPDFIPAELIAIAQEVRTQSGQIDERLMRRKLRDALDQIKQKPGEMAKGGFNAVRERLERSLANVGLRS